MKPAHLRAQLGAIPFRRFSLHLENGRALTVQRPNLAALSPDGGTLVLWGEDGGLAEIVETKAVTSFELVAGAFRKPAAGARAARPRVHGKSSRAAGPGGETPPELAGEDACGTNPPKPSNVRRSTAVRGRQARSVPPERETFRRRVTKG